MKRLVKITAGAAIALVALAGCTPLRRPEKGPPPPPPPPATSKVESLAGPHFAFGRSTLTDAGRAKVQDVAGTLNRYPDRSLQVNGYSDSMECDTATHCQELSQRRAETVTRALGEDGVSPGRISAHGFGKTNPVASNATAEGRAQNRRVEIILE